MPAVATVDGIRVEFYFDEHPPPHFHAKYAEYRALIRIDNLKIIKGALPRAQYRKIVQWASTRNSNSHFGIWWFFGVLRLVMSLGGSG